MALYRFRVLIDDKSEAFRDIEIRSNQTFLDFHKAIKKAFGFIGEEMACFYVSDEEWSKGSEVPLADMGFAEEGTTIPALMHETQIADHMRVGLVEDALRLPTVFAQETILATRAAIREEPFRALPSLPDAVTAGLDLASAPALGGYVVTLPKPRAAVLLRAAELSTGNPTVRRLMGQRRPKARCDTDWANGPGKLCAALAITGEHDGLDLFDPASPLRLVPPEPGSQPRGGAPAANVTPRIGISKAVDLPWRFTAA